MADGNPGGGAAFIDEKTTCSPIVWFGLRIQWINFQLVIVGIDNTSQKILITVDVEDWFQVENFKQSIPFSTWSDRELRVEQNTHALLDLFDSISIPDSHSPSSHTSGSPNGPLRPTGTFFVLGWIAKRLPRLVQEIFRRGHEVASHGIYHVLPSAYESDDFKTDLSDSRKLLEDIIGNRIFGYRAPSFSINEAYLEMISAAGYAYDSSYNSFDMHARYGRVDLKKYEKKGIVFRVSNSFFEVPVSNLIWRGRILPWGGGGYFRLMPFPLFQCGVKSILRNDGAYLFYMHPWEIDPAQPRVKDAPLTYRFRHYVNLKHSHAKLHKMFEEFNNCDFITCRQYIETKWQKDRFPKRNESKNTMWQDE